MKLFNRKTKQNSDDVQRELITKQFQVQHLKQTFSFLYPELDNEEVIAKLIYVLSCIAEPQLLSKLVDDFNLLGEKKLNEVTDFYEMFYRTKNLTEGDNND